MPKESVSSGMAITLCVGDDGYGDYIILHILPTGMIHNWAPIEIDPSEWTAV